jgi:hypothetical protein
MWCRSAETRSNRTLPVLKLASGKSSDTSSFIFLASWQASLDGFPVCYLPKIRNSKNDLRPCRRGPNAGTRFRYSAYAGPKRWINSFSSTRRTQSHRPREKIKAPARAAQLPLSSASPKVMNRTAAYYKGNLGDEIEKEKRKPPHAALDFCMIGSKM